MLIVWVHVCTVIYNCLHLNCNHTISLYFVLINRYSLLCYFLYVFVFLYTFKVHILFMMDICLIHNHISCVYICTCELCALKVMGILLFVSCCIDSFFFKLTIYFLFQRKCVLTDCHCSCGSHCVLLLLCGWLHKIEVEINLCFNWKWAFL